MKIDNVDLATSCLFSFVIALTPAAVAAASAPEQSFALPSNVPPLFATDSVRVTGPATGNNTVLCHGRADGAGNLVLQYANPSAGALTPAAGNFTVAVLRP